MSKYASEKEKATCTTIEIKQKKTSRTNLFHRQVRLVFISHKAFLLYNFSPKTEKPYRERLKAYRSYRWHKRA